MIKLFLMLISPVTGQQIHHPDYQENFGTFDERSMCEESGKNQAAFEQRLWIGEPVLFVPVCTDWEWV